MSSKMHDNHYDNNNVQNNDTSDIKKLIFVNKSQIIIAIFILILVGYVLIFQAIVKAYSHSITCSNPILDADPAQYVYYDDNKVQSNKAFCTVSLLGDSLINMPWSSFDLPGKILSGINGNAIGPILQRTDTVLAESNPQGVILFWDSDVCDISETKLSTSQIKELRDIYRNNLVATCNKILESGAKVAIAGPEMCGEGPVILNDASYYVELYESKLEMLEAYRDINKEVAEDLEVPYIDVRSAFIDAIGDWEYNNGCLTLDGEHPNNNGAIVEANLFSYVINEWLRSSSGICK